MADRGCWRRMLDSARPWPWRLAQCLLLLTLMYVCWWWFSSRYEIGLVQGEPCLPGRLYLIDRQARGFRHGDVIVFRTDGRTSPPYQPGSRFLKKVRGLPGDRVVVTPAGKVHVLGRGYYFASALEPRVVELLVNRLKKDGDFTADYPVNPGCYFVMGTLPDSYDSRYWGLVCGGQVAGKAWALW